MTPLALIDKLLAYQPESADEAAAQLRIVAHVRGGGALFDRRRWDGHLTGSAFLVDETLSRLLLIHHRKLDKWLQPGGHGEPTESDPVAVARREAEEETGVRGLLPAPSFLEPGGFFDLDVHVIPARKDEAEHEHLDIRTLFLVPAASAARLVADLAEVQAMRWFSLEEAAALPDVSVARAAHKLQRRLTKRNDER
jgi:8-oxo-dGTP pyrophosphatase MutT (NUDIX family)